MWATAPSDHDGMVIQDGLLVGDTDSGSFVPCFDPAAEPAAYWLRCFLQCPSSVSDSSEFQYGPYDAASGEPVALTIDAAFPPSAGQVTVSVSYGDGLNQWNVPWLVSETHSISVSVDAVGNVATVLFDGAVLGTVTRTMAVGTWTGAVVAYYTPGNPQPADGGFARLEAGLHALV